MAIKYDFGTHIVGFPSKLLAQTGGKHIYNITLTKDHDNMTFVSRGDFLDLDLYKEAPITTTLKGVVQKQARNGNWYIEVTEPSDALLVYMPALNAEDWTNRFRAESNFYNAKGDVVRAYELAVGDVFEISANGVTGSLAEKAKIEIDLATGKLKVGV